MNAVIYYPNPVLSDDNEDYVKGCSFDVYFEESEICIKDVNIQILAKCKLESKYLNELILEGKACVAVLVTSSTMYRQMFVFDASETEKQIQINKYAVKNKVEFCGFVLAKESIDDFNGKGEFNAIYFKTSSFKVKKGDVLARGKTRIIPIDDSVLERPISSIFTIRKDSSIKNDIEADFETSENGKIIIKLSERLNNLYYKMKDFNNGVLRRYLNGIIVFPVLVEAIAVICEECRKEDDEINDYSDKRWFRVIVQKLKDINVNIKDDCSFNSYTDLADRLLRGIAYDGLVSVDNTINDEVNTGEYINRGGND